MNQKKKSKNKKPNRKSFSISFWLGMIVTLGIFGHFLYTIIYNTIRNNSLDKNGLKTKAVVISEKNYFGNSPVSQSYSFSYQFYYKGKEYKGDTGDSRYELDDSIEIEFVPSNPEFNRPVKD
jgi:hypothetical protein